MISSAIKNLKQKPESYRHKFAFFTATGLSVAIFVTWAAFRGFISLPNVMVAYNETETSNTASIYESIEVSSPLVNSKDALKATWDEFGKQYNNLKESLLDVLAPFVSGIEVYESR